VLEWLTTAADQAQQLPGVHVPKHKTNLSASYIQLCTRLLCSAVPLCGQCVALADLRYSITAITHAFRHLTMQSTYEAAISGVVSGGGDRYDTMNVSQCAAVEY